MKTTRAKWLPQKAQDNLKIVGEQIKLARLRRNLSMAAMSERANCSELSLIRIERGEPSVSIGIYMRVLYGLGLHDDILQIAKQDETGRNLQDLELKNRNKHNKEEYDFD